MQTSGWQRSGDLSQAEKEYILASQAEQQAQQEARVCPAEA